MENTQTPPAPASEAEQGSHSALINAARVHFFAGRLQEARDTARQALDWMEPTFSANNPQLANVYVLHADAALGCISPENPDSLVSCLKLAATSLESAVTVLEQGMTTLELCLLKMRLVGTLFHLGDFEKALPFAFSLHQQVASLIDTEQVSIDILVSATGLLADGLYEVGRKAEAKSLIYRTVHNLRAEHYHNIEVVRMLQMLLSLQEEILLTEQEEAMVKEQSQGALQQG